MLACLYLGCASSAGTLTGTEVIDGTTYPLEARVGFVATKGRLSVETEGFVHGANVSFEIRAAAGTGAAEIDLSRPEAETGAAAYLQWKTNSDIDVGGFKISSIKSGTLRLQPVPTSTATPWSGELVGLTNAAAPAYGLDAQFELTLPQSALDLYNGK